MWAMLPNPSVRWVQLLLLVALTAFVGAMWGLERTIIPLIAKQDFGITSATVTLSFIVGFGLTKTLANLSAGGLMDRVGRRRVLLLGWAAGIPVPFLIIWAPAWGWIVAANLLLGINQGLCWSTTIVMMMDIMGERRRGLSTGLNEFAGYGGVAVATLAAGFIASTFAPRPHPFFLGIALAFLGLLLSLWLVRETAHYPREEASRRDDGDASPGFRRTFVASLHDRSLMSCNQAGLVTKINDATVWGLFPLFLDAHGLSAARIGAVAAIYPAVWGVSQLGTGFLSDYLGRKPLIVMGMLAQALGLWVVVTGEGFPFWIGGIAMLSLGTAAVYPTLIAFVGDHAHPLRRASSIGTYRWYRDGGFVAGALLGGLLADAMGFRPAFLIIGAIGIFSSMLVWAWMQEPSRRLRKLA